jgi:hypothetical protein
MRLAFVLTIAGAAALSVAAGLPGVVRSADPATQVVLAGISLGLLSALTPRPRRQLPVAQEARRRP